MLERVAERERATERFPEQRDPAIAGGARDLAIEIVDEIVHAARIVAMTGRRHREAALERGDLPVEEQSRAVDAGHENEMLFHTCYGTLRALTPAQIGRVTWTVISIFIVETIVFGLSVLPAFTFWTWTMTWVPEPMI